MALFMLSLGGHPADRGLYGQVLSVPRAVHAHQYALAVIGLVASVIGVFYYLRVIASMYFMPAKRDFPTGSPFRFAPGADVAVIMCAIMTLALGIYSGGLINIARIGADSLDRGAVAVPVAAAPPPVQRASAR